MNKDQRSLVVEYASSLSEDTLRFLTLRLAERFSGDLAEALEEMSKDKKMDSLLSAVDSADNLFNTLDQIREILQKECKKKNVLLKLSSSV